MNAKLDVKRIVVFLAIAFGIAWATGLVLYLTGGVFESPILIPGTPVTLALVLMATTYMWAPALAHILTRLFTREGWRDAALRPRLKRGWPYWLAAWFLPPVLTILGAVLFFALFPSTFDPSPSIVDETLAQMEQQSSGAAPIPAAVFYALIAVQTLVFAPLINVIFTFGEEFGWRAYLQPKLIPLGGRRAILLVGVIWGVWHWPVIAMGHNYGVFTRDYPGAPWSGMLMMVWVTLLYGTFLGWATLRGGSVWPAAIGHAAINATAGLSLLFAKGEPLLLLGPTPAGVIGLAAWTVVALWIFLSSRGLAAPEAEPGDAPPESAASHAAESSAAR